MAKINHVLWVLDEKKFFHCPTFFLSSLVFRISESIFFILGEKPRGYSAQIQNRNQRNKFILETEVQNTNYQWLQQNAIKTLQDTNKKNATLNLNGRLEKERKKRKQNKTKRKGKERKRKLKKKRVKLVVKQTKIRIENKRGKIKNKEKHF